MKDRLLIIGPPKSGKLTLIKSLFGSLPSNIPMDEPHSGLVHRVELSTKYFTTGIDLWIDEVNAIDNFKEWCDEFTSDEAREVRDVINGVVLCFKYDVGLDGIEMMIDCLNKLVEKFKNDNHQCDEVEGEGEWNGMVIAVGFGDVDEDFKLQCEDLFLVQGGIEMCHFHDSGKNEFGEIVGKERIRQIIECHDWEIEEFKDDVVIKATEDDDKDAKMVNLLNDEHIDLNKILEKLNTAKSEISKLSSDDAKRQYAQKIINDLGI